MRLNDFASAVTSSPPPSAARAVASPAPIRVAASSSWRSRRRTGPKMRSDAAPAPVMSSTRPDASNVGPSGRRAAIGAGLPGGTATRPTSSPLTTMEASARPARFSRTAERRKKGRSLMKASRARVLRTRNIGAISRFERTRPSFNTMTNGCTTRLYSVETCTARLTDGSDSS